MSLIHLPSLKSGDRVEHPFRVVGIERKDGDHPRTIVTLGNASGDIESAPIWERDTALLGMLAGVRKGDVVQVIASVSDYRGKKQLTLTSVRPLPPGQIDRRALVPSLSLEATEQYWQRLDARRQRIEAPRLRAVLDLFFEDDDFRARFGECPAAPKGHHARLGGLLQHVFEVAVIGHAMAQAMKADADLVVAGALLHDIGKLEAYDWTDTFEHTRIGTLHGHIVLGVRMLERRIAETGTRPCTAEELDLLEHFILSHHGTLEHGAAVRPATLEAELLHFADDTSAKGAAFQDALADDGNFDGDAETSLRRIWTLDRKIFRGAYDFGRAPQNQLPLD
jgi:3'-5' exoribonuclease